MTHNEVIDVINEINDYLFKTAYDELSFTTMLKVDSYLHNLKEEIRLEGLKNDRSVERNRIEKKK